MWRIHKNRVDQNLGGTYKSSEHYLDGRNKPTQGGTLVVPVPLAHYTHGLIPDYFVGKF